MSLNRGKYRIKIEIWEKYTTATRNELGELIKNERLAKTLFADVENRTGSLLAGKRVADTILTKTTHKITFPYKNFENLIPHEHFIMSHGKRFEIDYTQNEGFKNVEMQVFCTVKE